MGLGFIYNLTIRDSRIANREYLDYNPSENPKDAYMLKPQDVVLLLKIITIPESDRENWGQPKLATHLCISASEVNAGIKRLRTAGLIGRLGKSTNVKNNPYFPILPACEEFLISGVKYSFPAELGEYTRGIATSYAAPVFENKITTGNDPIPIWPYAEGDKRGLTLKPLYATVPKSLTLYPDIPFYDLLALLDAIRQGKTRERALAEKLLKEKLKYDAST